MSLKEISAYNITNKLTSDLNEANQYGVEPLGISTTPESLSIREVTQNKDGTWSENVAVQIKPLKTPLEIKSEDDSKINGVISDYENFAISYDKEIYDYNVQINQKKSQIISTINAAIGAGCSVSDEPKTAIINQVVCGIGSTIYDDKVAVNIYPNLSNYSSENIFTENQENLQSSNFGKGFEDIIKDNSGASVGLYRTVSAFKETGGGFFKTFTYDSTCAEYVNSISNLALEIDSLRKLRNKYLTPLNKIKEDKTNEEILRWGEKQSDIEIERSKEDIKKALSNVSSFVDNIVFDNLILFFDAAKDYTLDSKIENTTGIYKIYNWNNLGSDANRAVSSTESPTYDSVDGPSVWFNQYSITGKYFDLNKSYIDDGSGIVSGNVSYSLESWFKITDDSNLTSNLDTGGASIVGVSSSKGIGMQIYKPSQIRLDFGSRGNGSLVSTTNLSLNVWYHVICVREVGVNNRIYINGSLDNTSNISNLSVISSTAPMRIGFSTSNYIQQYFPGKISVVRMYTKALSDAEVKKNYDAHKSRYTAQI